MELLNRTWMGRVRALCSVGKRRDVNSVGRSPSRVFLAAVGILAFAACGDLPTENRVTIPQAEWTAQRADVGTVDVVCTTSQVAFGGPYAYEYGRLTLKLPASARSEDGSTRLVRFRFYAGQQIVRAANCTIPNSAKALEKINHLFRVTLPGQTVVGGGMAQLMSIGDEPVTLEPIEAKACQYGDPAAYPDCSKQGELPVDPVDSQTCSWWTGCGGYTGGGGGTSPDPGPIPCNTADGSLNTISPNFDPIWKASNYSPTTPQDQRLEQYHWVLQTTNGLVTSPMPVTPGPCGMQEAVNLTPPANAVGWVHTHPWAEGERQTTCGGGSPIYLGLPSPEDLAASQTWGNLPGYILDASGITRFTGANGAVLNGFDARFSRCGY